MNTKKCKWLQGHELTLFNADKVEWTMAFSPDILVLSEWHESSARKLWVWLKIFLKEGLCYGDWKAVFANRRVGGSVTLPQNVLQGLGEIDIPFDNNKFEENRHYKTCYVIKDSQCLRWALKQKRRGKIDHLVAGPMIVNFPFEEGCLIEDPLIDIFLLPSEWIRNLFVKLGDKTVQYKVWPVGIDTQKWNRIDNQGSKKWIVYAKNPEAGLLEAVSSELRARDLDFSLLETGRFTQENYRAYLGQAAGVIFLSRTETQGLAMFEAWACDVPTLHWNPKEFRLLEYRYPHASSCPYLTEACGFDFRDANEFPKALEKFFKHRSQFRPRQYVVENFTLKKSIENLLKFRS
jgi:glycosyltransferase involved in cell wall biosynthesis